MKRKNYNDKKGKILADKINNVHDKIDNLKIRDTILAGFILGVGFSIAFSSIVGSIKGNYTLKKEELNLLASVECEDNNSEENLEQSSVMINPNDIYVLDTENEHISMLDEYSNIDNPFRYYIVIKTDDKQYVTPFRYDLENYIKYGIKPSYDLRIRDNDFFKFWFSVYVNEYIENCPDNMPDSIIVFSGNEENYDYNETLVSLSDFKSNKEIKSGYTIDDLKEIQKDINCNHKMLKNIRKFLD